MIEERDLAEFRHTVLTGLTVGIGSIVLLFGSGAQILLQCVFQCEEHGVVRQGHGEDVSTSPLLFAFMNHRVVGVTMDGHMMLSLHFDDGKYLRVVPERNGLESYVVTTRHGACPISVN